MDEPTRGPLMFRVIRTRSRFRSVQRSQRRHRWSLSRPIVAAALVLCAGAIHAAEDEAKAIVKSMSDYLGGLETIQFRFNSAIEVITPQLEKIQFNSSGEALLSRPNKLRAQRTGGYADVEIVFDGETLSVHGRHVNGYAQIAAPGSVDRLVELLRAGHGVALPGADLLLANPYKALMADVLEAKHIGRDVIDGVDCEHLAFRNFDVDWQLWVEVGERPVPRKLVITSKTVNSAPQYSVWLTDFKTDPKLPANAFAFAVPDGARQLDANALLELDELPPDTPAGENQ